MQPDCSSLAYSNPSTLSERNRRREARSLRSFWLLARSSPKRGLTIISPRSSDGVFSSSPMKDLLLLCRSKTDRKKSEAVSCLQQLTASHRERVLVHLVTQGRDRREENHRAGIRSGIYHPGNHPGHCDQDVEPAGGLRLVQVPKSRSGPWASLFLRAKNPSSWSLYHTRGYWPPLLC